MADDKKYFRLGGNATNFWDPTQPGDNKVCNRQVAEFVITPRVNNALRNGWLIAATKKEFQAAAKEYGTVQKESADLQLVSDAVKEVSTAKVKQEAAEKSAEASQQKADDLLVDNKGLEDKILELNAKLEAAKGDKQETGPDDEAKTGADKTGATDKSKTGTGTEKPVDKKLQL